MKNILVMLITVTIGIIFAGSLLAPVIDDVTATEKTFTNDGYARYTSISSSSADEVVIEWDYTTPTVFTVGDQTIDYSEVTLSTSIVFGEDWSVRYNPSSSAVQYIGNENSDYLYASVSDTTNMSITLNGGTVTLVSGEATKTNDYSTAYYPDNNGPMTMKKSDEAAHLLKDSSIISANGITNIPGGSVGVRFEGTVADGYTFTYYRNTADVTESNVVSNYTENTSYLDLVDLTAITFDLTPSGGTATAATYSYFLIPYEVTAERTQHLDNAEIALMDAIPLMLIACLLLAAVGFIVYRGRD